MSMRAIRRSTVSGDSPAGWRPLRGMPKLAALFVILLGVAMLCGTAAGLAKDKTPTSRTLSGVVMDEAENLIKGAAIELTDLQTKKVLEIYSQEAGQYQYSDLRFDHDYTVQATYNGLSSEVRQVSSIDPRWHMVLNLTLLKPTK